jgi:U3 small nucleolar RNA-associated protein 23
MKINRRKRTQRTLAFYAHTFGFREPYQVLVDGTFCQQALANKVNVSEQLSKLLEGRVEVVTTSCAVVETESLLPATFGASLILKKFAARKCGHKSAKSGADCLASMVKNGNEHRYFLATQVTKSSSSSFDIPRVQRVPVDQCDNPVINMKVENVETTRRKIKHF